MLKVYVLKIVSACNFYYVRVNINRNMKGRKGSPPPGGDKCPTHTCAIYAMVVKVMRGERDITIGKSELDHLNKKHYRMWADFGWACSVAYRDDNGRLEAENQRLTAEIARLKTAVPDKVPAADPRNHVDGFCDALIVHPTGIVYKCTEYCRYDSKKCGAHQKYPHALEEK